MEENTSHEKELLRKIAQGDEKSFRIVFDRYKDRFYAAALKMTRSTDMAEDIVQEVFVTLWLRRSVLATVENPASYLFTIVYNSIHQQFRKLALERRMKQDVGQQIPAGECLTENILIEKENLQLLRDVIRQLPPRQQKIYRLSKEEGLNRDEIAQQLNISPNTVKNHLLKAMQYIRKHLKDVQLLIVGFML